MLEAIGNHKHGQLRLSIMFLEPSESLPEPRPKRLRIQIREHINFRVLTFHMIPKGVELMLFGSKKHFKAGLQQDHVLQLPAVGQQVCLREQNIG